MSVNWIEGARERVRVAGEAQKKLKMGSGVGGESQLTAVKLETGGSVIDGEFILGEDAGWRAAAYMVLRLVGVDVDSPRSWKWLRSKKSTILGGL